MWEAKHQDRRYTHISHDDTKGVGGPSCPSCNTNALPSEKLKATGCREEEYVAYKLQFEVEVL